jgi:hypothetical protein
MSESKFNFRTQAMIEQMGGFGLRGAFVYVGASKIQYKQLESKPVNSKITEMKDVYCDMLKGIVESVYDDAINERCGGYIPID